MINSRKEYQYYLEADRIAKSRPKTPNFKFRVKELIFPDPIWQFQKTLRKLEYYKNCKRGYFSLVNRFLITRKHKRLSCKLGFTIPPNVFGPGLSIAHHGTIVVNLAAKVGANCRLHACVNIGTEAGYDDRAPFIGDNCYIGPGAKIYGAIEIKNGTAIGANSVVNKSFEEENIAIAGAPAKKIGPVDTFEFLIPATYLIEKGYHNEELSGVPARDLNRRLKSE